VCVWATLPDLNKMEMEWNWHLCKNPRWRPPPFLNYYFVTRDHPQSPFVVLNLPFKFCIDQDIVI